MNDLEERLRIVMSASVADAVPRFTVADVKRGHRRHRARMTAAAVLAASAVALVAIFVPRPLLPTLFGPGPGSPASAPGRFVDPAYGWSIRYPSGLYVGHFRDEARSVAEGVRVTTFAPDLNEPSTGTPAMGWLRDFPANGVAVQIWALEGPPAFQPPPRDSRFPLGRSSFQRTRPYVGGGEPRPLYSSFQGDGFGFNVAVWFGPRASKNNVHAAWAMVRSLRFPPLRTGTIWHGTYYVLGLASRYSVGSITAFPVSALPPSGLRSRGGFYLLHNPRGFYVIKNEFADPAHHYRACAVTFDARAQQFTCRSTGLRWDRNGQPLGPHAPSSPDSSLTLHVATIAQDGHVLFSPFFGG